MTTLLYSNISSGACGQGALDRPRRQEETAIDPGDATGADQQGDVRIGELARQPQVTFALAHDLAQQRAGTAHEVVAFVDQVVAIHDEAADCLALGHQARRERAVLVVPDPLAEAVRVDGLVLALALFEDPKGGGGPQRGRH